MKRRIGFLLLTLQAFPLLSIAFNGQNNMDIPSDVLDSLRSVRRFSDLQTKFRVTIQRRPIFGGMLMIHNRTSGQAHRTILDAAEANDSCRPYSFCVPLEINKRPDTLMYLPKCVELPRCAGGCCDTVANCIARVVRQVTVKVWACKFHGKEGNTTDLTCSPSDVRTEEHLDCSCM